MMGERKPKLFLCRTVRPQVFFAEGGKQQLWACRTAGLPDCRPKETSATKIAHTL